MTMWKNKAKKLMTALLCAALLSTNLQTIQPVYAAQLMDESDVILAEEETTNSPERNSEEESQLKETETVSEEQEETQETNSTDTLQTEVTETVSEEQKETQASEEEETTVTEETESEEEDDIQETEESQTEDVSNQETTTEESEEIVIISEVVVNPLYEGIISKSALESEIETIHEQEEQKRSGINTYSASNAYSSIEDAAVYVREQMVRRNHTVSFTIPQSLYDADDKVPYRIVDCAVEHTEKCSGQEGDALRWGYGGYEVMLSRSSQTIEITYTILYYTTYEQEQKLTQTVNKVIRSMSLDEQDDYYKITLIHDYICDCVDYDYDTTEDDYIKFTAYGALCEGKAVCQGYAVLFYRLCKQAGLPVRVITGTGQGQPHAWNIVKRGDDGYYNVDCTWDGQGTKTIEKWCLKNDKDFKDHVRNEEYTTEEFYQTYPMTQISHSITRRDPLDCENLKYLSLVTTDDTKISLSADGKPKIVIFYNKNNAYCQSTLQNISKYIADFAGAEIVALETGKATKEEVKAFRQDYGCDEIAFCYETENSDFEAAKNNYIEAANANPNIMYEPVICYIDADNRLQYITLYSYSQSFSAARILTDLRQYCGYTYKAPEEPVNPDEPEPSITYTITYILGGGVNSSENPETYTSQTDTIILKDARRIGYVFEGWYRDRDFTSERVTQIEKGTTGNLFLFAKWSVDTESPLEYTITYVLNGGENSRFNPTKYTLESSTISLYDASWTGASFDGWYKDPEFNEQVTEIAEGSKGDITLYAKWKIYAPEVLLEIAGNTVAIELPGEYKTETEQKILGRINAIRLEACKQGVRHPDYNDGRRLTMEDYVPLQWSADLEEIARQRAAEATVTAAHTRPNGESCFSAVTLNNIRTSGECLAWNNEGLMTGIEQWYAEKKDWDNQTGKVTGHYRIMISPMYTHMGIGAFKQSGGSYYGVALSINAYDSVANMEKNDAHGRCKQTMEVFRSNVTKMEFDKNLATYIQEGDTYRLPINMELKGASSTVTYYAGGDWSSSDETVATVDKMGIVTAKSKGTAKLSLSVGSQTISTEITVYGAGESPIQVTAPTKTTYKTGDKLDVKGGKVTYLSGGKSVTKDITSDMVSGFDSGIPGICRVTVVCDGYTTGFDTLIVDAPVLEARLGQTLKEVKLPENDYGVYTWEDENQKVEAVGESSFKAFFTPKDTTSFQTLKDMEIKVIVRVSLEGGNITFKKNSFVYNGMEQAPKVVVEVAGKALIEDTDYRLSYQGDRKNTGTADVVIEGIGYYFGSIQTSFTIEPAPVTIKAEDLSILIGAPLPTADVYQVEVQGLAAGEKMIQEPTVDCAIENTKQAGRYAIVPKNADAGPNYVISYINGTLLVAEEYVSYSVTFDVRGHGEAPEAYIGIKAGSTILRPVQEPTAEGYRFGGWYSDAACTKAWDFDTDTVQSDITLYANWLQASTDSGFAFQEIPDCSYTGKACNPTVCVYDGKTLLKQNKDYTIKYFNNINANKDGLKKKGSGQGADFNENLPYALITGKGNYKDVVKVNFNILPASIGTGNECAAAGMTLKYTSQSVIGSKPIKPFTSLKYVKALKEGTDYTLTLTVANGRDQSGKKLEEGTALENAVIPAGYEGEFLLTVKGVGNYGGSIQTSVYVADKDHILKNAKITLGKNLKDVEYKGKAVVLTPGITDSEDTFTVKIGTTVLEPVKDYSICYRSNNKVGKAEIILVGAGEYVGSKNVFFNIKGRPLAAKSISIEGLEDKTYTGTAWTQNGVKLTYLPENAVLKYGTDYTIRYSKNINKGTATILFCGKGMYSGELKKTFKIQPADISDSTKVTQSDGMKAITVPYSKAGAKPVEEIALFNSRGVSLQNGKDYTIQYKNNKAVAKPTDENPPTVLIKGKGNYTGEITVKFAIEKRSLNGSGIAVQTSAVNYQTGKAPDYDYTPSIKVMDGKSALSKGKDYDIVYLKNTQADWDAYIQSLKTQSVEESNVPSVEIHAVEGGSYYLDEPIRLLLPVYQNKFTKDNLTVEIDASTTVYFGEQVTPKVTVFYQGESGKVTLTENKDYTISYGANIQSGKNKGSITISGISPYYGSSVTVKFDIQQKSVTFDR